MPTKKKRRFRWFYVGLLFWIIFIGSLLAGLISLPLFRITDISVTGNRMVSTTSILERAKIMRGENIFLTSLGEAERRIENLTPVKRAKLERIFPSAILISITERTPFAVIIKEGRFLLIDDDGVVLKNQLGGSHDANDQDTTFLPAVVGLAGTAEAAGEHLDPKISDAIRNSITRLREYVSPETLQLEMVSNYNLNLLLDDLLKVKLGELSDVEQKIKTFGALLPDIEGRWDKVEYIDLSVVTAPVIKLRS